MARGITVRLTLAEAKALAFNVETELELAPNPARTTVPVVLWLPRADAVQLAGELDDALDAIAAADPDVTQHPSPPNESENAPCQPS